MNSLHQFETGQTYSTRLVTNYDTVVSITVLSRTAKTIKASTSEGIKTFRVSVHDGAEQVKPWGSYSMAPIVSAA